MVGLLIGSDAPLGDSLLEGMNVLMLKEGLLSGSENCFGGGTHVPAKVMSSLRDFEGKGLVGSLPAEAMLYLWDFE